MSANVDATVSALEHENANLYVPHNSALVMMESTKPKLSTTTSSETDDEPEQYAATEHLEAGHTDLLSAAEDEATLKFDVVSGDSISLFQKIKAAESELKITLNELEHMKHEFTRDIRPRLVSSCLILPAPLDSELTAFLHGLIHHISKREPTYLTARDVMWHKKTLHAEEFEYFMGHILSERIMIAEVWDESFGDIETAIYDSGPDGYDFYRGESDAQFNENADKTQDGVAKLSVIIWKWRQVIWAEVIQNVRCRTINDAEVLAALALQLKCLDLGVKKLKYFSDSALVVNVITGKHTIQMNDPERGKNMRAKCFLLRNLREKFETLIAVRRPRQLMFLADSLLRYDGVPTGPAVEEMLKKWGPHLEGAAPLFRVYQNRAAKEIILTYEKKADNYNKKLDTTFYVMVEKDMKLDTLVQLDATLSPDGLYIAIDKFDQNLQILCRTFGAYCLMGPFPYLQILCRTFGADCLMGPFP